MSACVDYSLCLYGQVNYIIFVPSFSIGLRMISKLYALLMEFNILLFRKPPAPWVCFEIEMRWSERWRKLLLLCIVLRN